MKAITREEKIMSGENLTPITRKEMFLAKAAGQNVTTPTPITREEIFLSKISGSGDTIAPVEGTAIPVGVPVEKIYFNTNNTIEQTNAYLSQLTYVQTDLIEYPLYPVYAYVRDGVLRGIAVLSMGNNSFVIGYVNGNGSLKVLYGDDTAHTGWETQINNGYEYSVATDFMGNNLTYANLHNGVFLELSNADFSADLDGLPVGAENEKIKNVLSITPF